MSEELSHTQIELLELLKRLAKYRPDFFVDAACRGDGVDNFFPGQGQSALMQRAMLKCRTCPVRRDCHDYAMENLIEYGVWGGSSAADRRDWFISNTNASKAWAQLIEREQS